MNAKPIPFEQWKSANPDLVESAKECAFCDGEGHEECPLCKGDGTQEASAASADRMIVVVFMMLESPLLVLRVTVILVRVVAHAGCSIRQSAC